MKARAHLTGLIAAPHTPLKADGLLNLDLVAVQADLGAGAVRLARTEHLGTSRVESPVCHQLADRTSWFERRVERYARLGPQMAICEQFGDLVLDAVVAELKEARDERRVVVDQVLSEFEYIHREEGCKAAS